MDDRTRQQAAERYRAELAQRVTEIVGSVVRDDATNTIIDVLAKDLSESERKLVGKVAKSALLYTVTEKPEYIEDSIRRLEGRKP